MAIANPISVGYLGTVQSKAKNLKNDSFIKNCERISPQYKDENNEKVSWK